MSTTFGTKIWPATGPDSMAWNSVTNLAESRELSPGLFNPRTISWGPFGPQMVITADIFVIGLTYLLLIFVVSYNITRFQNDISNVFMGWKSLEVLGSKRMPRYE